MKKAVLIIMTVLFVTGCSKKQTTVSPGTQVFNKKTDIEKINQQNNQTQDSNAGTVIPTKVEYLEMPDIPDEFELLPQAQIGDISTIDVDLSVMSATMIYSEVFNMVIMPEEYEEKVLRLKGNFAVYISKSTGKRYYSVVIPDATKCCQQGIEFVWTGDHSYPEDYPAIGEEVIVTGIYKTTVTKDDLTYNYLQAQEISRF